MQTELTELIAAWNAYTNSKTERQFHEAEKTLMRFHKKYGTIDVATIRSIIN